MTYMYDLFFQTYLKLFFLLTPFAAVSVFLSMTEGMPRLVKRKIAIRTIGGMTVVTFVIFLFGRYIFEVFGITLDAFRIGAGSLLFLSAVGLIRGSTFYNSGEDREAIAIVPLSIPVIVGPGTTGTLFLMGAEIQGIQARLVSSLSLLLAVLSVGAILYIAAVADRLLKPRLLSVLTKITGLILASLAAQLIFTGIKNFMT